MVIMHHRSHMICGVQWYNLCHLDDVEMINMLISLCIYIYIVLMHIDCADEIPSFEILSKV